MKSTIGPQRASIVGFWPSLDVRVLDPVELSNQKFNPPPLDTCLIVKCPIFISKDLNWAYVQSFLLTNLANYEIIHLMNLPFISFPVAYSATDSPQAPCSGATDRGASPRPTDAQDTFATYGTIRRSGQIQLNDNALPLLTKEDIERLKGSPVVYELPAGQYKKGQIIDLIAPDEE